MVKSLASAFGLATLLATALVATSVVVACSSSDSSTFPPELPPPDAGSDAPGSLVGEGGLGPPDAAEAGPASCPAMLPAAFTPIWKPPTAAPSACSTAELTAYYHACLENPSVTETDGTCAKFKADPTTKACGDCAEPADNSGPIQWVSNRKAYLSNIGGCIAVAQGMSGPDSCGAAYSAAVECKRAACTYCFDEGGTFSQFSACQQDASKLGQCDSLGKDEAAKCAGYTAMGSPAVKCIKTTSNEADLTYYPRLVGVVCGPP